MKDLSRRAAENSQPLAPKEAKYHAAAAVPMKALRSPMKHLSIAALASAVFASSTTAVAQNLPLFELSSPAPGWQIVSANPGQSGVMTVRITNRATTTAHDLVFGPGGFLLSPQTISFVPIDGSPCVLTRIGVFQLLALQVIEIAANSTVECRFRVDRGTGHSYDEIFGWPTFPFDQNSPIGARVYIGTPTRIEFDTQLISFARVGNQWVQRLRVVASNTSNHDLVGVGFSSCYDTGSPQFRIDAAPVDGCDRPSLSGIQVCKFPQQYGLGDVAARGVAFCELELRAPVGTALPSYWFESFGNQFATRQGQYVYDIDATSDIFILKFGPPPAQGIPALRSWAIALMLSIIGLLSYRTLRRRRTE